MIVGKLELSMHLRSGNLPILMLEVSTQKLKQSQQHSTRFLELGEIFNSGKQGIDLLSTFTNRFFNDQSLRSSTNKNAIVLTSDGWTFFDEENKYEFTGWAALSNVSGNQERMIVLQRSTLHYFHRSNVSHIAVDSSATSLTGKSRRLLLNKNRGDGHSICTNFEFKVLPALTLSIDLQFLKDVSEAQWVSYHFEITAKATVNSRYIFRYQIKRDCYGYSC